MLPCGESSDSDLSESDLTESDLSKSDLSECDFSESDLSEFDLSDFDLFEILRIRLDLAVGNSGLSKSSESDFSGRNYDPVRNDPRVLEVRFADNR